MTKIVPIILTTYQQEIYNATERVVISTASAGVGTTYGFMFKAIKEANEGKLVTVIGNPQLHSSGGLWEIFSKQVVNMGGRASQSSLILSVGEGKIKLIASNSDIAMSAYVSNDLVIMDQRVIPEVAEYHYHRAKQIIFRVPVYDITDGYLSNKPHWTQQAGLVKTDEAGNPIGFKDFVKHVTCSLDDGYVFSHRGAYLEIINKPNCKYLTQYKF